MVSVKDYYRVLNIPSSASAEEIKKAFRKMALLYHPDRNSNTKLATEKFTEIQEAYSILSDLKKRTAYNYQRYSYNLTNQAYRQLAYSVDDILQLAIKLRNNVSRMDPYRIDRDHLFFEITDILSAHNLDILHSSDPVTNRKVIQLIVASTGPLSFVNKKEITKKLHTINANDSITKKYLQQYVNESTQQYYWGRYKIYIALAAAVLFCVAVFYSGK